MAAELSRAGSSMLFSSQYEAEEEDGMGMRIATVRISFRCATSPASFLRPCVGSTSLPWSTEEKF
jgi:hypothetical protein